MRFNAIQPGKSAESKLVEQSASQPQNTTAKTGPRSPTLKNRPQTSDTREKVTQTPIKTHSEPRQLIRVDESAVNQALGTGIDLLGKIDSKLHGNFYKHGSMMLKAPVQDQAFMLRCVVGLYLSAPDDTSPNAANPDWLDDQQERWGDDLMFLFEHSRTIDSLNDEGKFYFANKLEDMALSRYRGRNSDRDMEQALFHAKRQMSTIDE